MFWRKGAESRDTPHSPSEDPRRVAGRLRGKDWLKVTQGGAGELGCALGPAQPRQLLPLPVLPGCPLSRMVRWARGGEQPCARPRER